jgi:hypothetical protein
VTASQATEELVAPPPTEPARLNRPWRALVALVELLIAGVAVWAAFYCWPRGVATITEHYQNDITLESTRFVGSWLAGAIGFGTLAGVLVLDAVRQTILAMRVRPRKSRKS